jgi:hypothetical protein
MFTHWKWVLLKTLAVDLNFRVKLNLQMPLPMPLSVLQIPGLCGSFRVRVGSLWKSKVVVSKVVVGKVVVGKVVVSMVVVLVVSKARVVASKVVVVKKAVTGSWCMKLTLAAARSWGIYLVSHLTTCSKP